MSKQKTNQIRSGRALAMALGVSQMTIVRYLRRYDWPFARVPPWDAVVLPQIHEWRVGLQEDRSREPAPPVFTRAGRIPSDEEFDKAVREFEKSLPPCADLEAELRKISDVA